VVKMEWIYKSPTKQSSGYEDTNIKEYTRDMFLSATEEGKENMVNEIFEIYRGKNIYPIWYYNDEGIKAEIKKCIDKNVSFDGDTLSLKFYQGTSLCRFIFPNINEIDVRNNKNNSLADRFYSDHKLKRAIRFSLQYNKDASPTNLRRAIGMIEHGIPQNFLPMNAKALYEKFVPEGGIIYDFACGYGGRMLGALSSKNNYNYFGVEPNTETFQHLKELGKYIEEVTGRKNSFKIFNTVSEEFKINRENFVDFAFSSPPYFNLEKYSDEETQSYIKFPTLEEWLDGYVKPTIQSIYKFLKPDALYAVNIADFKMGKRQIEFVDKWIELSEECGFTYIKSVAMKLEGRSGDGLTRENGKEGIFLFRK
jgi:SAM-dependent methyltransferase